VHARASSPLCLASFSTTPSRTAATLIEPPSTARHSGPPRATGWMTGASSQAGTPKANRRPNPPSTMTTTTLPARLTRPRQAPPAGVTHPCPQPAALDPTALAWQPRNQSGAKPHNPSDRAPHRDPASRTPIRNSPFHTRALDNPRPFMDDREGCSSGWGCWAQVRQNFLRLDVEGARWPIRFSFRPSAGVSLTTRK